MNLPANIELTDEAIDAIAERVAQRLQQPTSSPEPWLTVEQAASHLAMSRSQLYAECSRRQSAEHPIPVHKHRSRSYFKASELDAWRNSGGGRRP